MAGYSEKPLAVKLGIRAGDRIKVSNAPADYPKMLRPLPCDVQISARYRSAVNLCHIFTKNERELRRALPKLMDCIHQNGCIWVSWPKRVSGVATDITEDTIRAVAVPLGLVDIKVCAVDEIWSGLKLVIRKELRTSASGRR